MARKNISVTIDETLLDWLDTRAGEEGRSRSNMLEQFLRTLMSPVEDF